MATAAVSPVSSVADGFRSVGGWLHVWDTGTEQVDKYFEAGRSPLPIWDPCFCVIMESPSSHSFMGRSLMHYKSEKHVEEVDVRLDGGKARFDHWWGYSASTSGEHYTHHTNADSAYEQGSPVTSRAKPSITDSTEPSTENMEVITPSNRIANFFSKRVKSNLKRTKSVTKLDRRKMNPNPSSGDAATNSESEGSPKFSLKRTMSLGRLGKKLKYKHGHLHITTPSPAPGVMQSSRSHESLLSSPTHLQNMDLSAPDVLIKPLHSSMLGQDHCFQITTSYGSKYYSCRSAEERESWIQHLRKSVEPHQEQTRRTDNSVRVWIQEVKNVPLKKRYFCEICLDGSVYARTSTKTAKTDSLFWGEQFEFTHLPPVEVLTINLYKEPEKRKKKEKNLLIGYLRIVTSEITGRSMVEKWYPVSSATVGKTTAKREELAQLRVKGRYHSVDILSMDMYTDFIQSLESDYTLLVDLLEPVISVRAKEEIATCLVHVLQKRHLACQFLSDIVMDEVDRIENDSLAFRGNTIATKAMEAYVKLIAAKYLPATLEEFIKTVLETEANCEVDPSRLSNNSELQAHQDTLMTYCQMAWFKIINSHANFPKELKQVFGCLRERCDKCARSDMSETLISACIFLRFLCPAILSPSLFKLTSSLPPTTSARNLTLIAKTIQTLANFTKFGDKEEYMLFLNEFVEREFSSMKEFIAQISNTENLDGAVEFDGFIDLGKELAVLHSLLQENLPKLSQETQEKVSDLQAVLDALDQALKEPQNSQSTKCNNIHVYNQIYNSGYSTSQQQNNGEGLSSVESKSHVMMTTGSEQITNQINDWTSYSSASSTTSKYEGSAFDNPHRNGGGTLPRNNKQTHFSTHPPYPSAPEFSTNTNKITMSPTADMTHKNMFSSQEIMLDNAMSKTTTQSNQTVNNYNASSSNRKPATVKTSLELIGMETISDTKEFNQRMYEKRKNSTDGATFRSHLTKIINTSSNTIDANTESSTVKSPSSEHNPMTSSSINSNITSSSSKNSTMMSPASQHATSAIMIHMQNTNLSSNQTTTPTTPQHPANPELNRKLDLESQPTRRLSEREIASSWGKMVSAAELVNGQGELIDLIKFVDAEDETADNGERSSQPSITQSAQQSHAPSDSYAPPPVPAKPLSFTNPLFGQLPSSQIGSNRRKNSNSNYDVTITSQQQQRQDSLSSGTSPHYQRKTSSDFAHPVAKNRNTSSSGNSVSDYDMKDIGASQTSNVPSKDISRTAKPPQDLNFSWQNYSAVNKSADQGWANLNKPQSRAPLSSSLPSQILFSNEQGVSHVAHIQAVPIMQSSHIQGVPTEFRNPALPRGSGAITPDDVFENETNIHRKSPSQTSVRMGVSSMQRKVHEQEKNKNQCEEELGLLKEQLAATQQMLYDTQERLKREEHQRQAVVDDYEKQVRKSQEELHRHQEETDKQLSQIYNKFEKQEEELRTEQMELQCVVSEKQRIIQAQEERIRALDAANNRLLSALGQLKDRYTLTSPQNGRNGGDNKISLNSENQGLKSSFC